VQTLTEQTNNEDRASRQTHTQGNNKNNEGKEKKNKWKHAECDHVQKGRKEQRSRILQAYENRISYTHEDGHVDQNI
jgi:hypothetical protein